MHDSEVGQKSQSALRFSKGDERPCLGRYGDVGQRHGAAPAPSNDDPASPALSSQVDDEEKPGLVGRVNSGEGDRGPGVELRDQLGGDREGLSGPEPEG